MAVVKEDLIVNSIIGEGTKFRGDFDLNGLLRIDGDFEGMIESEGKVLIGRHGDAVSERVKAKIIIIGGKFQGNLFATEKVTILSTGIINGNIETPRLIAEEGVMLNGNIKIVNKPGKKVKLSEQKELEEAKKALDEKNISL